MEHITHMSQKMLIERARRNSQSRQTFETAPPPYSSSESSDDSDDDEEDESQSPLKLTINAAHSIQGCNNLVPVSPTPLADASRFSTLLLHSINQMNNAISAEPSTSRRKLKVDLTINCGITIVGDRNIIGNVGLRPRPSAQVVASPAAPLASNAVVGAKRKVEEVSESPRGRRVVSYANLL